jgi:hypothetical protein
MEPPKTAPELPGSDPVREPQLVRLSRTSAQPTTPSAEPIDDFEEPDELNEHVEEPGDPDGVVEREVVESTKPIPEVLITAPNVKRRRHHPFLKALLILIIIAAAAFGAYYIGSKAAEQPTKTTAAKQAKTQTKTPAATASTTKTYTSTPFALSFGHPSTWAVAETADKITATSPSTSLPTSNGSKTTGVAVLTIQNKQTAIAGYPAAGAFEALESPKLTYTKPSTVQRAQTYLSLLGYTSAGEIDALFITGDSGYQQGQEVPMSDVVKGNPLVSVQFMSCGTDCNGKTPQVLSLKSSSWNSLALQSQITKMLESIVLN